GIGNCRFFAGDVAEKLNEVKHSLSKVDLVVLNPPRKGMQPAALETLLAVKATAIIYVSCRPQSLARDLDRLVQAGYKIALLQPFDMFPQTEQVETVVRLERD